MTAHVTLVMTEDDTRTHALQWAWVAAGAMLLFAGAAHGAVDPTASAAASPPVAANSSMSPDERDEAKADSSACAEAKTKAGKEGASAEDKAAVKTECGVDYMMVGNPSGSGHGKTTDTAAYPDETAKGMGATGSGAEYRQGYIDGSNDTMDTTNSSKAYNAGNSAEMTERFAGVNTKAVVAASTNTGGVDFNTGFSNTSSNPALQAALATKASAATAYPDETTRGLAAAATNANAYKAGYTDSANGTIAASSLKDPNYMAGWKAEGDATGAVTAYANSPATTQTAATSTADFNTGFSNASSNQNLQAALDAKAAAAYPDEGVRATAAAQVKTTTTANTASTAAYPDESTRGMAVASTQAAAATKSGPSAIEGYTTANGVKFGSAATASDLDSFYSNGTSTASAANTASTAAYPDESTRGMAAASTDAAKAKAAAAVASYPDESTRGVAVASAQAAAPSKVDFNTGFNTTSSNQNLQAALDAKAVAAYPDEGVRATAAAQVKATTAANQVASYPDESTRGIAVASTQAASTQVAAATKTGPSAIEGYTTANGVKFGSAATASDLDSFYSNGTSTAANTASTAAYPDESTRGMAAASTDAAKAKAAVAVASYPDESTRGMAVASTQAATANKAYNVASAAYPDETTKGLGAVGTGAQYAADYKAGQVAVANGTVNKSSSASNGYMAGVYEAMTNSGISVYNTGLGNTESLEASGVLKPTPLTNVGLTDVALSNNTALGADARDQANYYQTGYYGKTRVGSAEPYKYVSLDEAAAKGLPYGWDESAMVSDFGERGKTATTNGKSTSTNHKGDDYSIGGGNANANAMVQSSSNGKVIFAGNKGGYGQTVIVQAADGTKYQYSHLESGSINVAVGDDVGVGYKLAEVGATGNVTGAHLHYGVSTGSGYVDPQTAGNGNYNVASANAWSNTSANGAIAAPTLVANTKAAAPTRSAAASSGLTVNSNPLGYVATPNTSQNAATATNAAFSTNANGTTNTGGGLSLSSLLSSLGGNSTATGGNSAGNTDSVAASTDSGGVYSYDALLQGLTIEDALKNCAKTETVNHVQTNVNADGTTTTTTTKTTLCADTVAEAGK